MNTARTTSLPVAIATMPRPSVANAASTAGQRGLKAARPPINRLANPPASPTSAISRTVSTNHTEPVAR